MPPAWIAPSVYSGREICPDREYDMPRIALPRGVWDYDPAKPLGTPGGFGAVYEGFSMSHGELAIKRLHIRANHAADREMRIATDLAGRNLTKCHPGIRCG